MNIMRKNSFKKVMVFALTIISLISLIAFYVLEIIESSMILRIIAIIITVITVVIKVIIAIIDHKPLSTIMMEAGFLVVCLFNYLIAIGYD